MQTFDSPKVQSQAGEKSADAHAERATEEVYSSLDSDDGLKCLAKSVREMSRRLDKLEAEGKKVRAEMMRKSAEMNAQLADIEAQLNEFARLNRITDERLEREARSVLSEQSSKIAELWQSVDSIETKVQNLIGWMVYKASFIGFFGYL